MKNLTSLNGIWKIAIIALGNLLYVFGVVAFVIPGGLIVGGGTGISLVLNYYFNIPIEYFIGMFNTLMFLLAVFVLGRQFALSTLLSTVLFPVLLGLVQKVPGIDNITHDPLLCTIYGGLVMGIGLGVIFKVDAATGGMDIPLMIIQKKKGIPMGISMYISDTIILLLQMVYSGREGILFGIILIMVYTVILDKVMTMGQGYEKVEIISNKYEEINSLILVELERGTTLLKAETGYDKKDTKVIISAVDKRELNHMVNEVLKVDPEAFIIVHSVSKVAGRGFSIPRL